MKLIASSLVAWMALPVTPSAAAPPASAPPLGAPEPAPLQRPDPPPEIPPAPTDVAPPPEPAQAPAPTADEPVVAPAEAPVAAPPVDDPTLVDPEPAPIATQPFVAPRPDLPPPHSQEPPPRPGSGMRVGGGILIGLGVLDVLAGSIGLAAATGFAPDDTDARSLLRTVSALQLVLGLAEVGTGVGLAVTGVRRSRRLSKWKAMHAIAVPKSGNGMIVGGSVLLGVGAFDGLMLAVTASQTGNVAPLSVVVMVGELATGAALLGVGLTRRNRYRAWERSNFASPTFSLLPGGGMAMGMTGRF